MYANISLYTGEAYMRIYRFILSGLIVLYLLLTPKWILSGLATDPRAEVFKKPAPEWYGVVELWHVASFKPYRGSVTDYLDRAAREYNKAHTGVHIQVKGLTEKQFHERIERGETPDAYSFQSGLLYREQLSELPITALPKLISPARPAADGGLLYAVPYLVSGYALSVNTQLLYQRGLASPEGADRAFLQAALDSKQKKPQLYAPEILAARLELTGTLASREDFLGGGVLAGITDLYTVGMASRTEKLNLMLESVPITDYTDLVQYIGPARGADEKRRAVIADFAAYLLSEKVQRRLSDVGCAPASAEVTDLAYDEPLLAAFYAGVAAASAPEPFAYERHKSALTADALRALLREQGAQNAFNERLNVVLSGIS